MTTDEAVTAWKENGAERRAVTAAAARDEVRRFLGERFFRDQPSMSEDVALTDALLVASELVANAIRHGGGVRAFRLALADEGLWVTVTDRNPAWPPATVSVAGGSHPGEFGLRIVRRLSQDVTVTPAAGGKSIHALVPLRRPAPAPGGSPVHRSTTTSGASRLVPGSRSV
ncbi:ATP-binding protein [Streptomyces roseoviridis]|uniref:ATP-binding protein n=1 Tax=Streptomyces roseoviridis TaxID=67361 RepID=A0ABV5QSM7_9ACTN